MGNTRSPLRLSVASTLKRHFTAVKVVAVVALVVVIVAVVAVAILLKRNVAEDAPLLEMGGGSLDKQSSLLSPPPPPMFNEPWFKGVMTTACLLVVIVPLSVFFYGVFKDKQQRLTQNIAYPPEDDSFDSNLGKNLIPLTIFTGKQDSITGDDAPLKDTPQESKLSVPEKEDSFREGRIEEIIQLIPRVNAPANEEHYGTVKEKMDKFMRSLFSAIRKDEIFSFFKVIVKEHLKLLPENAELDISEEGRKKVNDEFQKACGTSYYALLTRIYNDGEDLDAFLEKHEKSLTEAVLVLIDHYSDERPEYRPLSLLHKWYDSQTAMSLREKSDAIREHISKSSCTEDDLWLVSIALNLSIRARQRLPDYVSK